MFLPNDKNLAEIPKIVYNGPYIPKEIYSMKKQCKPWLFLISNLVTIFNLLCYYSVRSMWYGIMRFTFEALPYALFVLIILAALSHTFLTINRKYPLVYFVIQTMINLFFLALNGVVIYFSLDASIYFIREFCHVALITGMIGALFFTFTNLHKCPVFQKKWFPSVLLLSLLIIGFFSQTEIVFSNKITSIPAVYAVEDTYQIVFTSRAKGTGWVTIDGVEYSDTYAGYRRSEGTVHKITVPMIALDHAGEYTVSARSMHLRGPFSAFQGKTVSETYHWKGVTPEDGLNYYVISDTHNTQNAPAGAGTYFGNDLDFLICCGDTASWIDTEDDCTQMLRLAGSIAKGQVPVIYARGNHETKGTMAHEFYRYVGADGENFYYTFRIKNVWGVVLDIGEDHGDQYSEFYGAAKFNAYRRAQTAFLDEILENAETEFDAPGVDYRIAVCHIPLTLKYTNDHAKAYKDTWIRRLNRMKLTMLYSGHVHQLWYIDDAFKDGAPLTLQPYYSGTRENNSSRIMTNARFPAILVSRRSTGQLLTDPEDVFDRHFIGLAVTSDGNHTTMKFTNENHEVLDDIVSPWFGNLNNGSSIVVENK